MKWQLKLFIVMMALATAIHFFGPNIVPTDEATHAEGEERVMHYEISKPNNIEEATEVLQKRTALIGEVIAKEKLDNNDLEKIHEHSYSLEAAVDKLRAEKAYKLEDDIDSLDEAIQALHYASENHEEAVSREWFGRMKLALTKF